MRALVALLAVSGVLFWSAPASAAPRPAPVSVTISGDDIRTPLVVRATDNGALFAALVDQVSWLRGAGQGGAPKQDGLGRKYTIVVEFKGAAKQTYHLYPLAKGGPRACRPGGRSSAWFYGRLNMSETLRAAGVPLPDHGESITGGIGGGESLADEAADAAPGLDAILGDLRRLLLLNAGIVIALTIGIAGIALLVRRRTR